jgi:hypothetical protein
MLPIWSQLTATLLVLLKTHQTQGKVRPAVFLYYPDKITVFGKEEVRHSSNTGCQM